MPNQRVGRLSGNCVRGIAALFMAQSTMAGAQMVLEEITVTATKREENVQDVSISMTAMTGDMIEAFGFQDALEVFNQIPNVFADEGSFSGALTIRGNATLNPTLAGESAGYLIWAQLDLRPGAFHFAQAHRGVRRLRYSRSWFLRYPHYRSGNKRPY